MEQGFHMIGGEDKTSYAKNSWLQWLILEKVMPDLDECMAELVDEMGSDLQNGVKVGDLGCSSGPNAFLTAKNIIQTFDKHYQMNKHHNEVPEEIPTIQYFLNDLVSNDFNLLFKGLPKFYEKMEKENVRKKGGCIIAAVPGTFYGKLFPDQSMHFLHSSCSLHWLSQAPKELVTGTGMSMNKLNIYCARTSPPAAQKVYANQFRRDFSIFLRMRSRELVQQGQLLLTFICENKEEEDAHNILHLMGSALTDMVTEGCIEKEKLECFNLPIYFAPVDEIRKVIEDEGSFTVLKFHSFKTPLDSGFEFSAEFEDDDDAVPGKARYVTTYLRAIYEPVLAIHFGEEIMDDLFRRYAEKFIHVLHCGQPLYYDLVVISLKKTLGVLHIGR